jgi:hypothetical protein
VDRCHRHDVELARGIPCAACIADPAPLGETATSEHIDDELLILANECVGHKRVLWRHAEELLENGTAQDKNLAAKLSAESTKWLRLAREIRGEVSQRKQLREAIEHEKAMQGKRGPT